MTSLINVSYTSGNSGFPHQTQHHNCYRLKNDVTTRQPWTETAAVLPLQDSVTYYSCCMRAGMVTGRDGGEIFGWLNAKMPITIFVRADKEAVWLAIIILREGIYFQS